MGSGFRNWDRLSVNVDEKSVLVVLADGVGGNIKGGTAAEMTVEKFKLLHREKTLTPDRIAAHFRDLSVEMRKVNLEMATTVILALIRKKGRGLEVYYTWAGDSRFFLLTTDNRRLKKGAFAARRGGKNLYILSEDDTIPWKFFQLGEIDINQVTKSNGRNRLFFSLPRDGEKMGKRIIKARVRYGDTLLFCTDGFWERFPDQSEIIKWMGSDIRGFKKKFLKFMDAEVESGTKVDNSTYIRVDLNEDIFKNTIK
ncbi:MAG: protein phosphatase 2C domain-containing protein [Candidatus Aminicenantes bacterium]|nr:protein phosphatase 2C domain-containing protein [Candidatus Aminicenantes bacterium]